MIIRPAFKSDKHEILKFCKNTFSWGDYVGDVWDSWMNEGDLLVLEDNKPKGIAHAVYADEQVWIEGIRINPDFRRLGAASKLVCEIEHLAKQKKKTLSFMLIDVTNSTSIAMAKKLGYTIYQTWGFFSLEAKSTSDYFVTFDNDVDDIPQYVKSWRWIPLDSVTKSELQNKKRIVFATNDNKTSIGILTDSEHFEKTLVVTFFSGSIISDKNLLKYIENFGYKNNYKRIQIICKESLEQHKNLQKRNSFHLMKKKLN